MIPITISFIFHTVVAVWTTTRIEYIDELTLLNRMLVTHLTVIVHGVEALALNFA